MDTGHPQTASGHKDSTATPSLLVLGGEIVEPGERRRADIAIANGRITALGDLAAEADTSAHVIDASGCVVAAGLVDLFARLGEPGNEEAETVGSGTAAAAAGGFTAVVAQPDTDPPLDRLGQLAELQRNAAGRPSAVVAAATITHERAGRRLSPMAELADAGVRWFSDVGPLDDLGLLRRALLYAEPLGGTISVRPRTCGLNGGAAMAEGAVSARMGLAGEPAASEELAAAAAIGVAQLTGGRLHLDRVSTAGTVELMLAARAAGVNVSASVTAEHLLFTDADAEGYDTLMRADPPYRTAADRAALIAGVQDRVIDAVVSGHSPVSPQAKDLPFDEAPAGIAALETCAAIVLSHPEISLESALDALSWRPGELACATHFGGGAIQPDQPANLVVLGLGLDPDNAWTVGQRGSLSMARNTPHRHRPLRAQVRATVSRGRLVFADGVLCEGADMFDPLVAGMTR